MKVFIGLVLLVACCVVIGANATTTSPQKAGVLQSYPPDGYALTKCGVLNHNTEPDSVVAPLGWRIAAIQLDENLGAKTDLLSLVIKQAYSGTHLDSFPVDGSASRVATLSSANTIKFFQGKAGSNRDYLPVNTDKAYFDMTVNGGTFTVAWCAHLVRIMNSSEDRVSDSTIGVEGAHDLVIPQFLER